MINKWGTIAGGNTNRNIIIAKDGQEVSGFTKHGINRAIGDTYKRAGVNPINILDTLKNPIKILPMKSNLGGRSKTYIGNKSIVRINPDTDKIITVNPYSKK